MADKGNYYKRRTIKWLKDLGYQAESVEKLQRIVTKGGRMVFLKKDIFASDGIAIGKGEVIFWNSILTRHNLAEHIRNYLAVPFPACEHLKQWVLVWEVRAKEPEVVDVADVKEVKE